ncbi:MAG: RluA family pseudouridine synthase [Pseudomonadales bacterium]
MNDEVDERDRADAPPQARSAAAGARQVVVVRDDAGQRIDNFLLRELAGVPRSRIYRMLRSGEVRVNGGRVKPTQRLVAGDRIRIPPVRTAAAEDPARTGAAAAFIGDRLLQQLEQAVLFEDERLLVVNKPAGLAVHGGSGLSYGAIEALRRMRPDVPLSLAHRLDRDTSGCLLLAKSRGVLQSLHSALRERQVRKHYELIVHGRWPRRVTTVRLALHRYHTASGERRVRVATDGKPSRTDFSIRAQSAQATRLEARLHTGRTHQIRVHAQASGHAVVGDEKYASEAQLDLARSLNIRRLCLHAWYLAFELDGQRLRFEAPPPADFERAWTALTAVDVD